MAILIKKNRIYFNLIDMALLSLMIEGLLSGCTPTPRMTISHTVPSSLADNITYTKLEANYLTPLPNSIPKLQKECTKRAQDVIKLITSVKNKNIELKAIRELNK